MSLLFHVAVVLLVRVRASMGWRLLSNVQYYFYVYDYNCY